MYGHLGTSLADEPRKLTSRPGQLLSANRDVRVPSDSRRQAHVRAEGPNDRSRWEETLGGTRHVLLGTFKLTFASYLGVTVLPSSDSDSDSESPFTGKGPSVLTTAARCYPEGLGT